MKVALISDIHMGVHKNSDIFMKSQISFIKNQFVPYLEKNNIEQIFFLGDLFDNRSSTNTKVLNEVFYLFDEYLKNFKIQLIIGNHDCYYNSCVSTNSLKFLDKFSNVNIVETVTSIQLDGKNITMVPWIVDNLEFIREFQKHPCDVCLGHFNISGFQFNKFRKSDDGIQKKLFGNCKKVFTGHFHIRNKQTYSGCEIIYIGSPFQLTRNDIDEERGFAILNLEDLSYENINNETSLKFIKLKYPEKFSKGRIEGNIIDVHIDYDDSYNEAKIERYIQKIEEHSPIIPPNVYIDNSSDLQSSFDIEKCNIGSITELMSEYINGLDIENKDQIYGTLIDLYNEAKGDL